MKLLDKEYSEATDEELLSRIQNGEECIIDYIMDKYKNLVRRKAKSMFLVGADQEDLIQEGMIGLFKAIRNYNVTKEASFFTFAELCITRQLFTAVKSAKRQKHQPLNTYISIDEGMPGSCNNVDGGDIKSLSEVLSSEKQNPEEVIIDKENVAGLEYRMEKELSLFEKKVLDSHMEGLTYGQIAQVLGKDAKATDNALQRVKNKVRKVIIENSNN